MRSVSWSSAKCLHKGRIVLEISPILGRAISMLEMFQKIQKARQMHVVKTVRLLFDMSFCKAFIGYLRIRMKLEEDFDVSRPRNGCKALLEPIYKSIT